MSPVQRLTDQPILVATNTFPSYAKFPFDFFNQVQSRVVDIYDKDCSALIATKTGSGKTVCAEMFMAHEINVRGGKAMYLAPLRALAKEKLDDWTDLAHSFDGNGISICTGDYRLTPARKKELENSKIIVMTSEMLNSRCRNYKSENNEWLQDIGTIVVDESHLLTVPGRGDHLEVGLMKLAQIATNLRIVFLSATMPNVAEIADWIAYQLTKKQTFLLESDYRPCPLGIHYQKYWDGNKLYEQNEEEKVNAALNIVHDYSDDKFLVFVHTKRTGEMMLRALKGSGIEAEFHNADLEKAKRHSVEKSFRSGSLHAIVATSTLAWGLNLPARRVIIVGVHRGLNEVDTYDIWQMAGRAGRPGYDPRGDVYILVPDSKADYHIERLSKHQRIESRLLDYVGGGQDEDGKEKAPHYKTLAFHLVSEIHHGGIKNRDDVYKWYENTLANFQSKSFDDDIVDATLNLLVKYKAIRQEQDGSIEVTGIGKVASMFYYSPFDVADLKRNFDVVFKHGLHNNDLILSYALGNVDTIRMGICNKKEREEMSNYAAKLRMMLGDNLPETAVKGGYVHWCLLTGSETGSFAAMARNVQMDFPRTRTVLEALDSMSAKWERADFFDELESRVSYGVEPHLIPLVKIPGIGAVRATKLYNAGIKSIRDFVDRATDLPKILNMKADRIKDFVADAEKVMLLP